MKIINLVIAVVILSSLVWAGSSNAASEQDYKCYITLKNEAEIAFYRWPSREVNLHILGLIGSTRHSSSGKKHVISAVEECVALDAEFTTAKAQALDKLTPR